MRIASSNLFAFLRLNRICVYFTLSVFFAHCGHAQTLTPVPVINEVAGGTVCAEHTDTLGDGCPATQAKLTGPWGSVTDGAGNVYLMDSTDNAIRKIDAKTGIITLVAGNSATNCATDTLHGNGCPATQVKLNSPRSPVFDHFGNLVFVDTSNNLVRSMNLQTGIITNIAGTGVAATAIPSNSNPQVANKTAFASAVDIAFDAAGNLYISSSGKATINLVLAINGRIDPANSLTYCLAGTGTAGHTNDGGPGYKAEINAPRGIFIDPAGGIYFAEYGANTAGNTSRIRKITSPFTNGTLNFDNAIITTVAGNGVVTNASTGIVGDNGPATSAELNDADDTFMDSAGYIYIVQYGGTGNIIRRIDPFTQYISSYAGATGATKTAGDGGPAIEATLGGPEAGHIDNFGRLYSDNTYSSNFRVVSLDTLLPWTNIGSTSAASNVIVQAANDLKLVSATIAPASTSPEFAIGTLSGCSLNDSLSAAAYCTLPITFTPSLPGKRTAQLVLTDDSNIVSLIGLTGYGSAPQFSFNSAAISTIAGTGTAGNSNLTGAASAAQLSAPHGGAIDGAGNVYIADTGNNIIRRIDTSGNISTVVGTGTADFSGDSGAATLATLHGPQAVAVDAAGDLFIADTGNNRVRYVDARTGNISTIAGNGTPAYTGDSGDPMQASLNLPQGIALEPDGTVDVADTGNNVVRRFYPHGALITTVAGTGSAAYSGDGGMGQFAALNAPSALAFDPLGNLYIADTGNAVIRMVAPWGQISTFAGQHGTSQNAGDNGTAAAAALIAPTDVASDAAGDIYIASGNQVRVVNASGVINTIAGDGETGDYSGTGPARSAILTATNLMLDASGNVYVTDAADQLLLEVNAAVSGTIDMGVQAPMSTSSPQTITLLNTGNTPMTISSLTASTNYALQDSGSNPCNTSTPVNPGNSCTLSVTFSPDVNGSFPGSITITDNALNAASATQTIPLTGSARSIAITGTVVSITGPSPVVYGAATPPTAVATITNGSSPTGKVTFSVNGIDISPAVQLGSDGTASISLPGLQSGRSTIAASYAGDTYDASSSGSTQVTVQQAMLTVTADNMSRPYGTQNPGFTYSATGFGNGDTASVLSGAPAFSTTAIPNAPIGTYPISIATGTLSAANYTFNFVSGTLTVVAGGQYGYTIQPAVPTLTIRTTQTPKVILSLTPIGGYTGSVTLACSGLPTGSTCSFSPSTVVMNGVVTQVSTVTVSNTQASLHIYPVPLLGIGLPLVACIGLRKKRRWQAFLVWCAAGLILGLPTGCGSGGGAGQSYTVTVSASDNTAYPVNQTTSFEVVPTN